MVVEIVEEQAQETLAVARVGEAREVTAARVLAEPVPLGLKVALVGEILLDLVVLALLLGVILYPMI